MKPTRRPHPLPLCSYCRQSYRCGACNGWLLGPRRWCLPCILARAGSHGSAPWRQSNLYPEDHAERMALYEARAAVGLPLFENRWAG
jgi:hypothetical protein